VTDRINSFTVVLDSDIRIDDVEPIVNAIRMVRGVASVTGNVADQVSHVAQVRAKRELREQLFAVLAEEKS
jgi:hypothetical protein